MSMHTHDHGCNGCSGAETSNDAVFDSDAESIETSGRNHVVIARTAGATVTLPESDDFKNGESITILAPNGAVNLVVDDADEQTLPPANSTVAGGTGLTLYLVKAEDCGSNDLWIPA